MRFLPKVKIFNRADASKQVVPVNRRGATRQTISRFLHFNTTTPIWINTAVLENIAREFEENPVLFSVITTGANYLSNGKVKLKNVRTGDIITYEDALFNPDFQNDRTIQKAFGIFNKPNPLISRWEFLQNYLCTKWLFGNSFIYANAGVSMVNLQTVQALWNIWPQYMNVTLKGQYFSATEVDDVIKEWNWGLAGYLESTWRPDEILHRKEVNVRIQQNEDLIYGTSRVRPLTKPLSNIKIAYESENNVLQNRGARLLVTAGKDDNGVVPIDVKERKKLQKQFNEYGLADNQMQAIISEGFVDVKTIDQDIRKLGIFETISTDALSVANAYKVPFDLVRYNLTGSTFENQNAAEKRFYQNVIIPEFEDLLLDLNNFLKMSDSGYIFVPDFSHIAVLQEDEKSKATALNVTNTAMEKAFSKGAINYNTWLKAIGQPANDEIGEFHVWDLTPEQKQAIGISISGATETNTDGNVTNTGENE